MNKLKSVVIIFALCFGMVACSVDQVLTSLNVLIQAAGSIGTAIGAVSPADSAIVAGLAALASRGLNAIQSAYDTYKKSGAETDLQKVQAAISAVQTNLPAELAAAHVYSPSAQAKCAAWVNLTVTTLNIVAEALPQLQSAVTEKEKVAVVDKLSANAALTPEAVQARWVTEVCKGDKKCSALVSTHKHSKAVRVLSLGLAH